MSCNWLLLVGKLTHCKEKSVKYSDYCASHKFYIKKGRTPPNPCQTCGIGTKSYTGYCTTHYPRAAVEVVKYHRKKRFAEVMKNLLLFHDLQIILKPTL